VSTPLEVDPSRGANHDLAVARIGSSGRQLVSVVARVSTALVVGSFCNASPDPAAVRVSTSPVVDSLRDAKR
jgi:hypothetical protein